jgi:predicted aspartyl protease
MFLVSPILGKDVHILVDMGATHNVIDVNFARLACLLE